MRTPWPGPCQRERGRGTGTAPATRKARIKARETELFELDEYLNISVSTSHLSVGGWRSLSNDTATHGRYHRPSRDSPRQEYRQEYYSSARRNFHRFSDRYSDRYSDRCSDRYSDRDLNDHHPTTTRNFADFHSSHRSSTDLHSSSAHRNSSDLQSILVKAPSQHFQSFGGSNTNINGSSRSLSHSFLELHDEMSPGQAQLMERGRLRNQSLTFGVSEADLERAARLTFFLHNCPL